MQLLIANTAGKADKAIYVVTACLLRKVRSEICSLSIQLSHLVFQNFHLSLVLQHVVLVADKADITMLQHDNSMPHLLCYVSS